MFPFSFPSQPFGPDPNAILFQALIKKAMFGPGVTPAYTKIMKIAYAPPQGQGQGQGQGQADMMQLLSMLGGAAGGGDMGGGGGGGMDMAAMGGGMDMGGMGGMGMGGMGGGMDMGMGGMGGAGEAAGPVGFTEEELAAIEPTAVGGTGAAMAPMVSTEAVAQIEAALAVLKEGIKKLQDALEALTQGAGETKAARFRQDLLNYLRNLS